MYPKGSEFRYNLEEFSVTLHDLKVEGEPLSVDVTYCEDEVYAVWDEFGNEREFYQLSDGDRKLINAKLQDVLSLKKLERNGALRANEYSAEYGIDIA